jgi:hypothetical protein
MKETFDFEEIRSYRDDEVHAVLMRLTHDPAFLQMLPTLFPDQDINRIITFLQSMKTILEFQLGIIMPWVDREVEEKSTESVKLLGTENIDKSRAYLYISNHRDIILDSGFLNTGSSKLGLPLTEIGIGNNLIIYPWIRDIVRLNRSFIVNRGGSPREVLENSKRLSAYIRHDITERNHCVWLAQREGRAKDSDDRTQGSVLKMLNMSGEGDFLSNMQDLNICPLSISYEYDPCDFLKAKEFQAKRDNPNYKKQQGDDLFNMKTGIVGKKGNVVLYFVGDISDEIGEIGETNISRPEQIEAVANLIDRHIHKNYTIFANNKVAYDLLLETNRFAAEYNAEEKKTFETYLQEQLAKIEIENKDEAFLRHKILEMYANPLINQLKTKN